MIQTIQQQKIVYAQNENPLLKKDNWEASELGLEPAKGHGSYYLNFDLITIDWLKNAAMINNGVPQIMVQEYLGHESSEMTSRYAHIHNETMKAAFVDYQGKLIDIHGEPKAIEDLHDGQWLKANIITQSLPNGLCALPITHSSCPHANACLTCANFRTGHEHLPLHKKQLEETNKVIDSAKQNGWQRVVESNVAVAKNLKKIICKLEA